jgi:signal transduction histidine kinase
LRDSKVNVVIIIDSSITVVEDYRKQIVNGNIKLIYEPANSVTLVEADKRRLIQVISNLLNNAIKFTKEGNVTVSSILKRKDIGRDGAGGEERASEEVLIAVKDSGTGIDPELMPRLFTKFATKSYQGTGLGLFISKAIIDAHGGKMWAENNNNDNNDSSGKKLNGATLYFTLPVIDIMSVSVQVVEEGGSVNEQRQ